MRIFTSDNTNELFEISSKQIMNFGETLTPRGIVTKELIGVTLVLTNPRNRITNLKKRNFPIKSFCAETLWYLSENPSIKTITKYLPNWKNFSDDGEVVNSNYGVYWARHVKQCIQKIKEDKDTRQAMFNIYDSRFLTKITKDVPCTLGVQFFIRKNKLHMHVLNRSRDLVFGEFGGDIFSFTILQELVANELNVDVGEYVSHNGSLHIYERHFNMINDPDWSTDDDKIKNISKKIRFKYTNALKEIHAACNKSNNDSIYANDFLCDIILAKQIDVADFVYDLDQLQAKDLPTF